MEGPSPSSRPAEDRPAAPLRGERQPEKPEGPAPPPASRHVLGMRVDATSYAEVAAFVAERARAGAGGMVCVAAVHNAVQALDDPAFRRAMNAADRVTPDGVPLVWALRWLGVGGAQRVYGPSLLPALCARADNEGIPVGFYGGAPEVLDALVRRLRSDFPRLRVVFAASPPFRPLSPGEDADARAAIEASGARVLFVGLGCPKQELWMASHRDLPCVLVGVGAAFDFLAGRVRQAPQLLQRAGLEWLFRLCCEPRRLWRRYLLGNPRFVHGFVRHHLWRVPLPSSTGGASQPPPDARR